MRSGLEVGKMPKLNKEVYSNRNGKDGGIYSKGENLRHAHVLITVNILSIKRK